MKSNIMQLSTRAATLAAIILGHGLSSVSAMDRSPDVVTPDGMVLSATNELTREERFPSVEHRVKLYMGNWYAPPCDENNQPKLGWVDFSYTNQTENADWPSLVVAVDPNATRPFSYQIESVIEPDRLFFLEERILMDCLEGSKGGKGLFVDRVVARNNMQMYCYDAAGSLSVALYHVQREEGLDAVTIPTLVQFGDLRHSHVYGDVMVPHFKKFRSATTPGHLNQSAPETCTTADHQVLQTLRKTTAPQPIIWKFATTRHFRMLDKIYREDTPWHKKKPKAVFRGQLTGSLDGYMRRASDETNCMNMRRCRLVYTHAKSELVDAKLTSTRKRMPETLNGISLMAPVTTIRRLLEYKAVIMLEGNDVASGLKWALLSQSVVLMPRPLHTSWAME